VDVNANMVHGWLLSAALTACVLFMGMKRLASRSTWWRTLPSS